MASQPPTAAKSGVPSSRTAAAASRFAAGAPPWSFFVGSAVFHYLGPAFAVLLFARIDVLGVAWLRILSAAVIFAAWRRPWRAWAAADGRTRMTLLAWGAVLAVMNACFYIAIDRLPLGMVAAIEFVGPVLLAAFGARTRRNLLALALAVGGVAVLADVRLAGEPLAFGFAIANAALFTAYIVLGHRVASHPRLGGIEPEGASPQARDGIEPEGASPQARDGIEPEGASPQARDGIEPEGASPQARDGIEPEGASPQARDGIEPEGASPQARDGIDGLGAAMLLAAVVAAPIGAWDAAPALTDPVALLAAIGVGVSSSVIPYVCDQLAMRRMARATYALLVALLPATATVIGVVVLRQVPTAAEVAGVALVIAGVALHRESAGRV